jgi:hypothetical protein
LSEDDINQFFQYARESYQKKIESIEKALANPTPINSMQKLDLLFVRPMLKALEALYSDQIVLMGVYQQIRAKDADSIQNLAEKVNRGDKINNWWERTFHSESEIANGESNG